MMRAPPPNNVEPFFQVQNKLRNLVLLSSARDKDGSPSSHSRFIDQKRQKARTPLPPPLPPRQKLHASQSPLAYSPSPSAVAVPAVVSKDDPGCPRRPPLRRKRAIHAYQPSAPRLALYQGQGSTAKSTKSVCFQESVRMKHTIHINDVPDSVRRTYWYSIKEIKKIRAENRMTAKQIRSLLDHGRGRQPDQGLIVVEEEAPTALEKQQGQPKDEDGTVRPMLPLLLPSVQIRLNQQQLCGRGLEHLLSNEEESKARKRRRVLSTFAVVRSKKGGKRDSGGVRRLDLIGDKSQHNTNQPQGFGGRSSETYDLVAEEIYGNVSQEAARIAFQKALQDELEVCRDF